MHSKACAKDVGYSGEVGFRRRIYGRHAKSFAAGQIDATVVQPFSVSSGMWLDCQLRRTGGGGPGKGWLDLL